MRSSLLVSILAALVATGCSSPPESGPLPSPEQPGPAGPPPVAGQPAGPPAPGAPGPGTPPEAEGLVNPPPSGNGAPEVEGAILQAPTFELAEGAETITLTVHIEGPLSKGQIDLMTFGEDGAPRPLHVEKYTSSPVRITAPAVLADDLYVAVMDYNKGESLSPDSVHGGLQEPIKLAGEDLEVRVTLGKEAEWAKREGPPPEGKTPPEGPAPGGAPPGAPAPR